MRAIPLLLIVAVTVAAGAPRGAIDSEITDIIISLTEDTAVEVQHDFSVTSAAAADAAGDLGKPIGRRLRRLPRNTGETLDQQLQRLSGMKGVKYAVPDLRVMPAAVHPDGGAGAAVPQTLPGGSSRGVFRAYQWGMSRVGAQYAWSIATGAKDKESAVTVCVVDSGIDDKHPGLKPNLAQGVGMNAVNGEDEFDLTDVLGHGTTLAGVIAGTGAEGGPVGLNWDNVNLLSCKFMGPAGYGSTSDAVQCIDFCLAQKAHIISASWTTGTLPNPPLEEAVARTAEAGALLVLAAGNFGANMKQVPYYPQVYSRQYDNVLVVAASDDYDEHIFFSNFDPSSVHLSAPGVMIYTTAVGGVYNWTSGTSIAAPFVSGAAALLQAVSQDKLGTTLSATELKQHILDSVERLPALLGRTSTAGRLRVDWALQLLLGRELSPATPCLARPSQRSSKCSGGRGGGRLPARRSLVEMGEGEGSDAGSSVAAAAQDRPHSRPFRSVEMQRELVRQLEQQGQQQTATEQGAGLRRRQRRMQAAFPF